MLPKKVLIFILRLGTVAVTQPLKVVALGGDQQ